MPDALSPSFPVRDKPSTVRIADQRDEAHLYALLVSLHAHNSAGWKFPFRPEIVLNRIEAGTRPLPEPGREDEAIPRSDLFNKMNACIGVIGEPGQPLIGSVGLFIEPVMWFSDMVGMIELWLFVRPDARGAHYERDLFDFALWAHDSMKASLGPNYRMPFPLHTGFMHRGKRFPAMERVWQRLSGAVKAGVLFVRD